jgi:hypothetical protein
MTHIIEEDVSVTAGLSVGSMGGVTGPAGAPAPPRGAAAANGEKLVVTPQTWPFT